MLVHLSIQNYALIEDLQVGFTKGFTTITGETGAGKSILLESLGLVLGNRADRSALRDRDSKCVVEAEFNIGAYSGLKAFFEREDLDYDPQTFLRREIRPNGKSRAFVNDSPVTLDTLSELGGRLIDVHSQHQTLELTQHDFQLRVVDALAGNGPVLSVYRSARDAYRETISEWKRLKEARDAAFREQDYNEFLLQELQKADLREGLQEELEEKHSELSNAEQIIQALGEGDRLYQEEEYGLLSALGRIRQIAAKLAGFGKRFEALHQRVQSLYIEADDIGAEFGDLAAEQQANPAMLEEINSRLQDLYDLQKKHGVSGMAELIRIREQLEVQVGDTAEMDSRIDRLEEQLRVQERRLTELADQLHEKRKKALPELVDRLEGELEGLGMPNAAFKWELLSREDFGQKGRDVLELLFTANRGGNFGSLKKTASGGELSRIMLTIKAILSSYEKLPTMMFDEIDTGVSGEISVRMGDIMQRMSRHMQVFAITHLPQVASKGHQQFKVYKEDQEGRTHTRMKRLSQQERVLELAQMLGGDRNSEAALTHARELLN